MRRIREEWIPQLECRVRNAQEYSDISEDEEREYHSIVSINEHVNSEEGDDCAISLLHMHNIIPT